MCGSLTCLKKSGLVMLVNNDLSFLVTELFSDD